MGTPNIAYYGVGSYDWQGFNADLQPLGKIATLTPKTLTHYYFEGDDPIADHYGKPFDPSVKLWDLSPDASFATYCYFFSSDTDNLDWQVGTSSSSTTVPLVMMAKCLDGAAPSLDVGWRKQPDIRYAYDRSGCGNALSQSTQVNQFSRLVSDITYNGYCIYTRVGCMEYSSNNIQIKYAVRSGTDNLVSYINADPEHRWVTYLANTLYYGNSTERINDMMYVDADAEDASFGRPAYRCFPVADAYADRPIPDYAPLRDYIQEGHSDWVGDKVFSPFMYFPTYSGSPTWFGATGNDYLFSNTYNIGMSRSLTRNQWRDGINNIPGTSYKIYGDWLRCNFSRKEFDDVAYHWEVMMWEPFNNFEIPNGTPASAISTNQNLRLFTKLIIDDQKGLTIGEATLRAVLHENAYIGFYFVPTQTLASSGVLGSEGNGVNIYLPKRVNGIPNGEYYTGEEIADVPYADLTSTQEFLDESGSGDYNPITGDVGDFETRNHYGYGPSGGVNYWLATETMFNDLVDYLNKFHSREEPTPPTTPLDYTDQDSREQWNNYYAAKEAMQADMFADWQGTDPWQYFTTVKWYPWKPPAYPNTTDHLCIGPVDTMIATDYLNTATKEINMGTFDLTTNNNKLPHYNNWRDYDCTISLMLPFLGSVELDPAFVIHHTVKVTYCIDWITGSATAYIYRDNFCFDSRSGTVGVDVPLSLASIGTYQNAITQIEVAQKNNALKMAGGALTLLGSIALAPFTGGSSLALGGAAIAGTTALTQGVLNEENLEYQLDHTPMQIGSVSSASPLCGTVVDWRPQMLIAYPTSEADESIYSKTVGYACCSQGTLGSFKGYTVASNINLDNVSCTKTEAQMIREQLKSGIINN